MADVAVTILQVVAEVRLVAKDIKDNDRQARRLLKRVTTIEPAVLAVKHGKKRLPSESLLQLLETVGKIRKFLDVYARTAILNRVWKRKSHAATFRDFGDDLTEGRQALQLDVVVDTWAKEDASDRLEDIENLKDEMKRMERHSTDNRAEFSRAVKALEKDERSELTAWVEIDFDEDLDFEGSILLGSGGFGEVKTATWNGSEVAVKHLRADNLRRDLIRALRNEIRIHSSLHFDHVVQLYAASTIAPNLCMVMEYSSEGSLWQYLHSTREPLAHALQAAFALDIARGMSFLHKKGILHRDLKSANVLVFANRRLKLCDFGLSKIKAESSSRSAKGSVGTANWMSPEEMDGGATSELTDVYSFGVVCFEVATRMEPFQGMRPPQLIGAVLYKEQRPTIPEWASASPDVVSLMGRCWKQDPAQRPEGFVPVVKDLSRVVERVGDPRSHRSAANDVTSSLGLKRNDGGAASIAPSTAPVTDSGSLGASPLDSVPVERPMAPAAPSPGPSMQDATTDRAALLALYRATDGARSETNEGWKDKEGWGTSRPIGEWHGVTVDGEGRVIKLVLDDNNLTGPISPELGRLTALQKLSLYGNQLSGEIPSELGELKLLTWLTLYTNKLTGSIPTALGGLTAVETLGLQDNELSGPIPPALGGLRSLMALGLGNNKLTGPIPPALGGLRSLIALGLGNNKLTGPIPVELGRLIALQYLEVNDNQLSGHIPSALGSLTALIKLHLYNNRLTGPIPRELGRLTNLQELSLGQNQLSGGIPPALGNLKGLIKLLLYKNQLTGPIPERLGRLTALQHLEVNGNQLSGGIPPALGSLTALVKLILYNNQLTGPIPPSLGGLMSLTWLGLDNNKLAGHIPPALGSLKALIMLHLHNNQLTGPIPRELERLTNLQELSLRQNQLSGGIPPALGSLKALIKLYLHNNQLTGPIPAELGRLTALQHLEVNDNQLSGHIPSALGSLKALIKLHLYNNQLTGPIPRDLGRLTNLQELALHQNQLSGGIPPALGSRKALIKLYLYNNQLTGPIPRELGRLTNLEQLALSQNQLSGPIPTALGGLRALQGLWLQGNNLLGSKADVQRILPTCGKVFI